MKVRASVRGRGIRAISLNGSSGKACPIASRGEHFAAMTSAGCCNIGGNELFHKLAKISLLRNNPIFCRRTVIRTEYQSTDHELQRHDVERVSI